ncbi:MAG: exodeoxyribonuclease VII small subunit [Epsilonproteobacteria bacterium]|nr:exodeoxyribonuclease VII small subunit [Campylobacterota bacterium]
MAEKKESFETKLENAKKILEQLLDPNITIEKSVKAYEQGMQELQDAQKILENAQLKIQEIKNNES